MPSTAKLPTPLQEYVYKSRYARWLETEQRREHWPETVKRYVDYFVNKFPGYPANDINSAILKLEVMPSMRALMTAGPALERDPMAGFNPVAGDTLVVTREYGNVPIKTLRGKTATVVNKNGEWATATFNSYGIQPLKKITLGLNSNGRREEYATANHRWLLSNGTVVPTEQLQVGDHIDFVTAPKAEVDADYTLGIRHGIIYGDGSVVRAQQRVKGYMVRLCGVGKAFLPFFDGYPVSYPPSANGDPLVMLYDDFAATHSLKELPSEHESESYILGFIRGWLSTDGHISKRDSQTSLCCNLAGKDWLYQYAERAGFVIQGATLQPRTTNYGDRKEDSFVVRVSRSSLVSDDILSPIKQQYLKPLDSRFHVRSVEDTDRVEEVFCAEVPDTNTFVLAGGLVTGNCAFVAIDDVRAFDEILYILMCGTGMGFSVERQFINQLPIIGATAVVDPHGKFTIHTQDAMQELETTIVVRDSKGGWSDAFRSLLAYLYSGFIPKWDTSQVRPAGEKLKTFGGRASGPQPLIDLFNFAVSTFKNAIGRKLNSVECHDLVCKIADIVVVGGVRRSALISLSNLSDDRMRGAKNGQWWVIDPQRALANNSAAYTERPGMELFMKEWISLIESKSGERGIFNRQAAINKAIATGRRDASKVVGVNPCFAPGTLIHTRSGTFPIEDLVGEDVTVWDGSKYVTIDNFRVTGENIETLNVTLQDGSEIKATPYHKFVLADGTKVEMKDLEVGMKLLISQAPEAEFGTKTNSAYLKGFMVGDGTVGVSGPLLWLYEPKYMCSTRLLDSASETQEEFIKSTRELSELGFIQAGAGRKRMQGLTQRRTELTAWGSNYKNGLPAEVFAWDKQSKVDFLAGLFDADGCAMDSSNGFGYQIASTSKKLLLDVQTLLKTLNVFGKVALNKEQGAVNFNDGYGDYSTQKLHRLTLSQEAAIEFAKQAKFERLQSFADRSMKYQLKPRWNAIVSIEYAGIEEKVYCCTVPESHQVSLAVGVTTGQCAEITLRSAGVCNLTEVVIRAEDSLPTLLEKVRLATIMGTYQSLLTNFRYVRDIWKTNQEEERLLGVSLTGIMDHSILCNTTNEAKRWLREMKDCAIATNRIWARKLGINQSVAVTTVKPSGTVSQLVDSASGEHTRYSEYYIRTVRADKKDPLAQLMRLQGFPVEDCVSKPDSTDIFSFPVKAPKNSVFRNDRTALEQLEHYLMVQSIWSEHNVSITVYVRDHEWMGVGDWVYRHFDEIAGVSFLPHTDHSYRQAPYTECSEEDYLALLNKMPQFDWDALSLFEKDDSTVNTKELACTAGVCDIL